jgi:hypothetical protein
MDYVLKELPFFCLPVSVFLLMWQLIILYVSGPYTIRDIAENFET